MTTFSHLYRGHPLRLLVRFGALALIAVAVLGWFQPGADWRGVVVWFLGCMVAFEIVVIPLASLLDRALGAGLAGTAAAPNMRTYVRVPALLSGLLALVFLPLILKLGTGTYTSFVGVPISDYLLRWVLANLVLFGGSALLYSIQLRLKR